MGCVVGPGENPLKPGEIAIRVNACMECGKSVPMKGMPTIVGITVIEFPSMAEDGSAVGDPEGVEGIEWGVLCKKHADMATHEWPMFGEPRKLGA